MIDAFIATRKHKWDRLTSLLKTISDGHSQSLTAQEIEEFGVLYREASSDLAVARRDFPSSSVVEYLNSLLGQAQPYLYARRGGKLRAIKRFYGTEFPATFRRNSRLVLIAFLAFFLPALVAWFLVESSSEAQAVLTPSGIMQRVQEARQSGSWVNIPAADSSAEASFIITNNIRVAIMAFVGGILLGSLTLYVLIANGIMLGAVGAVSAKGGISLILWSFISPHGWIELSVIFISGGAGLGIAKAVLVPGLSTRRDALVRAGRDSATLLLGGASLLVIAGTIEGFFSPSSAPSIAKIIFGACTGVALYSYLFLAGRARSSTDQSPILRLASRWRRGSSTSDTYQAARR